MQTDSFLEDNGFLPVDIETLLSKYHVKDCDLLIRKAVSYEDRPLIVYGVQSRLVLAKKKVIKEHGDEYKNKFIFKTNDEIVPYLKELLEDLNPNGSAVVEDNITQSLIDTGITKDEYESLTSSIAHTVMEPIDYNSPQYNSDTKEYPVESTMEQPLNSVHSESDKISQEELGVGSVDRASPLERKPKLPIGQCRYGVPYLEVKELKQDVIGLKESLYNEIEKEDLDDFFRRLSDRAVKSLEEGWYL